MTCYIARILVVDTDDNQFIKYRLSGIAPNMSAAAKMFREFVYGEMNTANKYTPMRNIYIEEIKIADSKYYLSEYSKITHYQYKYRIRADPLSKYYEYIKLNI